MRILYGLMIVVMSMIMWACAGPPTPYQKDDGIGGGYSDIFLRDNFYEVKFRGNLDTDEATRKKYLFRRAAELCVEEGFRDFKVINEPPNIQTGQSKAVIECIP